MNGQTISGNVTNVGSSPDIPRVFGVIVFFAAASHWTASVATLIIHITCGRHVISLSNRGIKSSFWQSACRTLSQKVEDNWSITVRLGLGSFQTCIGGLWQVFSLANGFFNSPCSRSCTLFVTGRIIAPEGVFMKLGSVGANFKSLEMTVYHPDNPESLQVALSQLRLCFAWASCLLDSHITSLRVVRCFDADCWKLSCGWLCLHSGLIEFFFSLSLSELCFIFCKWAFVPSWKKLRYNVDQND